MDKNNCNQLTHLQVQRNIYRIIKVSKVFDHRKVCLNIHVQTYFYTEEGGESWINLHAFRDWFQGSYVSQEVSDFGIVL